MGAQRDGFLGHDPFNQNSNRSQREKWSTSNGEPVFSKLLRLDQTDPLSFGPKFPEILVEWIAPLDSVIDLLYCFIRICHLAKLLYHRKSKETVRAPLPAKI